MVALRCSVIVGTSHVFSVNTAGFCLDLRVQGPSSIPLAFAMSPVALSTEKSQVEHGHSLLKSSPSKAQPSKSKAVPPLIIQPTPNSPPKSNTSSRTSKPIITWFQRKLAGTGRAKRKESHRVAVEALNKNRGGPTSLPSRASPRIVSSPVPSPPYGDRHNRTESTDIPLQRRTMSLNGDEQYSAYGDDNSFVNSSVARESTWSPASALEADDDASVRPIPPSAPPSPSPSRSSSSYLSDPRTFRSIAASTKPTTLLSIDINGNGMAHIAQAPITPPTYVNRYPLHMRNSSSGPQPSGSPITFSSLPHSSSRPSSLINSGPQSAISQGHPVLQAPLHTAHHPRNNPRPSSPPMDNASVLTLASSAYAIPGARSNIGQSATASARGVGDSQSHFGGSITYGDVESSSQFVVGDDERLDERDVDASVRALRPRSTRRGSWESEASRWSARVPPGTGTPSLTRERSQRTSTSIKTGLLTTENYDQDNADAEQDDPSPVTSVSIEAPSFDHDAERPQNRAYNKALPEVSEGSDPNIASEMVEKASTLPHDPKEQGVRFSLDTRTSLTEKDGSSISHGQDTDTM
ncbi:hypothetical protein H0H93_008324 [Arthromyces matolae]|nr:hypothetical protein H0H93_008324 [Arthromyces matolae]